MSAVPRITAVLKDEASRKGGANSPSRDATCRETSIIMSDQGGRSQYVLVIR